jgi:hypothetical protein
MSFPVFASGDVLNASDMNGVGLWLVKTQTVGSGVSSVTVSGAFSSEYENYYVTWTGGSQSADTNVGLQLGSTTTGYYGAFLYGINTVNSPFAAAVLNAASFTFFAGGNTNGSQGSATIYGPNLAKKTYMDSDVNGYSTVSGHFNGREDSNTQHTSFTIIPNSGTLTGGTIRVYGYRN